MRALYYSTSYLFSDTNNRLHIKNKYYIMSLYTVKLHSIISGYRYFICSTLTPWGYKSSAIY